MTKKNKKSIHLQSSIYPISYDLTIHPDLESFTFSGNEIIKINIIKKTNKITLHSKDIDIETVKIISKRKENNNKKIEQYSIKTTCNIKEETVTFYFKNIINKGQSDLSIVFCGIINNTLRGFYKSKYIFEGKEKYLATTQFEATDARRCFPCFDEPKHKATFKISLIVSDKHTAISNTLPVDIKEHSSGYKIVSFAPTPKMSTYLLAFIVGEFEYVEGRTKPIKKFLRSGPSSSLVRGPKNSFIGEVNNKGTQVRVFTTKGKSHQAKFALEVAIKSLEFYNEYFNIPYPLPTLDMIAIPDFESGAMENWGAVTYRETAILVDEKNSSLPNKQWVALVIAHELAHQWFGNLVTMKWWTDLWLNEGFASYIEYLAIDKIFPSWQIWDQFLTSDHNVALNLDGLSNSHPIEITVNHPNEINEIFDKISYSKSASMIRMLSVYLGKDKFREGLQHYLKKHSYKNTNTIDLWNSFEKVSHKPINKIMSLWTKETGYPLVTLSTRSGIGENWKIGQERFFSSRVKAREYINSKNRKHTWPIPIKYESNNEILSLLMTKKNVALIGTSIGKINIDEETFIRVKYDSVTLKKLANEIKNEKLSTKDRLGIIRDLFALAEGGYIKTDVVLQFSLNYKNEKEYIVWAEISSGINRIYNLISNENFENKYKSYALSLFSPLAEEIGFEKIRNEKHSNTFLRNLAIYQAGYYGDKNIINKATKLFKNHKEIPIDANIRTTIYRIMAQNGVENNWKLFEKLYKEETLHEEKDRFGYALASFKNTDLIKKTLAFIMSDNVKNQDTPHLLAMVWQNKEGRELTWNFIKNKWHIILKKYGEGGHFLSRLLTPLGNHVNIKDLNDAKKFFTKNSAPGAKRTLEQVYEKIESNITWIRDDKKVIKNWLEKNY